ncbi:MAG: hypothetical protein J0626_10770, partial [Rhodospirillaceae bacterium]|nr:hypothetical protein [Rhodospirillaceae bacterium]
MQRPSWPVLRDAKVLPVLNLSSNLPCTSSSKASTRHQHQHHHHHHHQTSSTRGRTTHRTPPSHLHGRRL